MTSGLQLPEYTTHTGRPGPPETQTPSPTVTGSTDAQSSWWKGVRIERDYLLTFLLKFRVSSHFTGLSPTTDLKGS